MSNDDDVIIIGTGQFRVPPDAESPLNGELKDMRNRLAEIKTFVENHGNDAETIAGLNDARQALAAAYYRTIELHEA